MGRPGGLQASLRDALVSGGLTGGAASLDHRLMAAMPSASERSGSRTTGHEIVPPLDSKVNDVGRRPTRVEPPLFGNYFLPILFPSLQNADGKEGDWIALCPAR